MCLLIGAKRVKVLSTWAAENCTSNPVQKVLRHGLAVDIILSYLSRRGSAGLMRDDPPSFRSHSRRTHPPLPVCSLPCTCISWSPGPSHPFASQHSPRPLPGAGDAKIRMGHSFKKARPISSSMDHWQRRRRRRAARLPRLSRPFSYSVAAEDERGDSRASGSLPPSLGTP
ncbi:hypothetical protein LZ32DRAFT_602968 [Colletotrichum eremochloae]|nr:hypothetical protein LZ32DRAFT_602968 [Colletotrichum eremochloae]